MSFPHIDEDDMSSPEVFVPEEEESRQPLTTEEQSPPLPYTELKRNVVSVTQEVRSGVEEEFIIIISCIKEEVVEFLCSLFSPYRTS